MDLLELRSKQCIGGSLSCKNKGQIDSDAIVQYEDILPTLMEFVGGDEIEGIDGKSFLKALFGKRKNTVALLTVYIIISRKGQPIRYVASGTRDIN